MIVNGDGDINGGNHSENRFRRPFISQVMQVKRLHKSRFAIITIIKIIISEMVCACSFFPLLAPHSSHSTDNFTLFIT